MLVVAHGLVMILGRESRVGWWEKNKPRLPRDVFQPLGLRTRFVAAAYLDDFSGRIWAQRAGEGLPVGWCSGCHGIAFSSRLAGANSGEPSLQLLENLRISAEARLEAHLRLNRGVCHAESENFIEFKCLVPQIIHLNRKIASSVALCAPKLTEMINPNLAPPLPNSKEKGEEKNLSLPTNQAILVSNQSGYPKL